MLQLRIWNAPDDVDPIRLRLVQDGPDVKLIVMDGDGTHESRGNLLVFRGDGTIEKYTAVDDKFGLNLNKDGALDIQQCE